MYLTNNDKPLYGMKNKTFCRAILLMGLMASFNESVAQDCKNYFDEVYDKMTGQTTVVSKHKLTFIENGKSANILVFIEGNVVAISITTKNLGCFDSGNEINLLFTDGSRAELHNMSKFNCSGDAALYLGGVFGYSDIQTLSSKTIGSIRISSIKNSVQKDLTAAEGKAFLNTMACAKSKVYIPSEELH